MKITNGSPFLIDQTLSFSLADLNRLGFFSSDGYKAMEVNIYGRDLLQERNTIWIAVSTQQENWYLELDYEVDGTPINYRLELVTVPSNLGMGKDLENGVSGHR